MERLLEEVKVMSEPSLVFWIRQAVTKDLTSSSKFSGSCVLTLQPLPTGNEADGHITVHGCSSISFSYHWFQASFTSRSGRFQPKVTSKEPWFQRSTGNSSSIRIRNNCWKRKVDQLVFSFLYFSWQQLHSQVNNQGIYQSQACDSKMIKFRD